MGCENKENFRGNIEVMILEGHILTEVYYDRV